MESTMNDIKLLKTQVKAQGKNLALLENKNHHTAGRKKNGIETNEKAEVNGLQERQQT